jgi:hypothetical protein
MLLVPNFFSKETCINQGIYRNVILLTNYSLRPILLFASMDVSRHILVLDTSILAKSNMGRREYNFLCKVGYDLNLLGSDSLNSSHA